MHDDRTLIENRISRALDTRIRVAVYGDSVPVSLEVWQAPGEPVDAAEGIAASYTPAREGDPWGPPWGTCWMHITGQVPAEWAGQTVEAVLDIGFDTTQPGFSCEGLVYRPDGSPVKAINPYNKWVRIADSAEGGEAVELYVEAASNPVILDGHTFAPTQLGDVETAGDRPLYRITTMRLAVFEPRVWELVADMEVLAELMHELSPEAARRWRILRALDGALDVLDLQDIASTADLARERLAGVLADPAEASAHRISAIGHAHIDSAWLWPLRETVRKVARTTANVTALLEDNPEFIYAMSSAQQFAWLEEHHPELFARVSAAVAEGRFVPVGGMWVESDTNMPGGEALARQFTHGKRYFLEKFGIETEEVWLPDSFGYTAAMPQLVALSNSKWFLTQKISWNQYNTFPHHTFYWEGIDGTRVFTHFPPANTYNSEISGKEMATAARNYAEKGVAGRSLVPFGHGDGGGGPTREMLARAKRLSDVEGSARVHIERPAEFFAAAQAEYPDAPVWVGELYLEFHRGTYTSQAGTKHGNRRSEHLLREAELWCATASVRTGREYPYEELDTLWKIVLLNQFHDILPGSSIAWVHREARAAYTLLGEAVEGIIHFAQRELAGEPGGEVVFNAAPHERDGIPGLGARPRESAAATGAALTAVTLTEIEHGYQLDNGLLVVSVDGSGLIRSIVDIATQRELIAPGGAGNLLQLHQDFPNAWDAWDVDSFYRNTVTDLTAVDEVSASASEADAVAVRVRRSFGASTVSQLITLRAGVNRVDIETEVDWHEQEKFLKLSFDVDVHTDRSASEVQFGHVYRPTHTNTRWDTAKFEICAHRWVHVAEPGHGVALVNDRTYGHDITRAAREGGGTYTTMRASLLRAPRFPDPETDHGVHTFGHALVVGADIPDAVREGYRINLPERTVAGSNTVEPLLYLDNPAVIVEAIKLADDRGGDVVVRLYESSGGRADTTLRAGFEVAAARSTDLLEREFADTREFDVIDSAIPLRLRPFEILTLRLVRNT